jgi:hypothetical protein
MKYDYHKFIFSTAQMAKAGRRWANCLAKCNPGICERKWIRPGCEVQPLPSPFRLLAAVAVFQLFDDILDGDTRRRSLIAIS